MTANTIDLSFNITDLSQNVDLVNSIFLKTKFLTLSHPVNKDRGHWTVGIDLNILSSEYTNGTIQDYQNFKSAVSYKVTEDSVYIWNNTFSTNTFYNISDFIYILPGEDPQSIYIKELKWSDNYPFYNFYLIGRWRRKLDINGNPVTENINEFEMAIINSPANEAHQPSDVRYVLDMTISKSSETTTII